MTLIAYHGDPAIKAKLVAQLKAHAAADELVKGRYWKNGKGCAVGCSIHSGDHAEYEPRFGIPQMLAHLEDCIFENLPNDKAQKWPIRFSEAIPVGADLSLVQWQFLDFTTSEALGWEEAEPVRAACQPALDVIRALARGEPVSESAAWSAESAAWSAAGGAERSAAWSAESAVWSAQSAAWSVAGGATQSAMGSATGSVVSAAWSAESAACSAARSATGGAAWRAAWVRFAARLLELLAAAPVLKETGAA